ncbi:MAG TPA: Uma2 family endonuclease [Candidatus Angelobacter sp.]|jgi:Uma2 family endonuclease|nr:Uma2 family endonuclease [Candidatus Angelobacter sp.]
MATSTRISFDDYLRLPDDGRRYELNEGELLMVPSPAPQHNLIRQRIAMDLMQFVKARDLGIILEEMDFRLGPNTVLNPDIAYVTKETVVRIDLERSPIDGAPARAIEVISPRNRADETVKKVHQYLDAGSRSVWLVYRTLRLIEIHFRKDSIPQRRDIREPDRLTDSSVLPGFSISLPYIFDDQR